MLEIGNKAKVMTVLVTPKKRKEPNRNQGTKKEEKKKAQKSRLYSRLAAAVNIVDSKCGRKNALGRQLYDGGRRRK